MGTLRALLFIALGFSFGIYGANLPSTHAADPEDQARFDPSKWPPTFKLKETDGTQLITIEANSWVQSKPESGGWRVHYFIGWAADQFTGFVDAQGHRHGTWTHHPERGDSVETYWHHGRKVSSLEEWGRLNPRD
ncbi:MAG: hypothetical protein AAGF84_03865 [Planctomycetota bacterium]